MNGITMMNRSHILTRNIIERLFGDDDLHFGLRSKLGTSLIIIVACCVLHNLARRHREVDNVNVELDDEVERANEDIFGDFKLKKILNVLVSSLCFT